MEGPTEKDEERVIFTEIIRKSMASGSFYGGKMSNLSSYNSSSLETSGEHSNRDAGKRDKEEVVLRSEQRGNVI